MIFKIPNFFNENRKTYRKSNKPLFNIIPESIVKKYSNLFYFTKIVDNLTRISFYLCGSGILVNQNIYVINSYNFMIGHCVKTLPRQNIIEWSDLMKVLYNNYI